MNVPGPLQPIGPLPSLVYWRRRAAVLGGLALLLFMTVYACSGEGTSTAGTATPVVGESPAPTPSGAGAGDGSVNHPYVPQVGPSSSPAPSAVAAPVRPSVQPTQTRPAGPVGSAGPCTDAELTITPVPGQTSFPAGSYPYFSLTIKNTSNRACTRDIGADQQELRVMQGARRVWSSDDCAARHGKDVRTLAPGDQVSFQVSWPETLTSAPKCPQPRVMSASGAYQVVARLGSKLSKPVSFHLS